VFTGLIEELGRVAARPTPNRFRFEARAVLEDAAVGSSLAVDGCCLTVVALGGGWWEADVVDETLARTTLGGLAPGDPVNLERPLRLADRLGGHLVAGHVDAVGTVEAAAPRLRVAVPAGLLRYVAEKGSVAVDGVSLTVTEVDGAGFGVAIVPHTAGATTLGFRRPGDGVNVEVDLLARYVERLLRE
jgi:riboflavin synthase